MRMDAEILRPSWQRWAIISFLTLLLHLMVFLARVQWQTSSALPRIEVQQMDPEKLKAIRKQWKTPKGLLLNRDKTKPNEKEAPPDARYMSDRNIRVEKEQRARNTEVIPRAGSPATPKAAPPKTATPKNRPLRLREIGVPFRLTPQPPEQRHSTQSDRQAQQRSQTQGGDQSIDEKKLPEGSQNLLNAQESIYYSFYARIHEAIGPIWESQTREVMGHRHLSPGEYATIVDVILNRNGEISEIRHLQSSGIPELDRVVDSSWYRVKRFPNPPTKLLDKDGQVHLLYTFRVDVGEGSLFQYLPPERLY
ncbi:MAG: hypothetical protein A2428_13165 [Bdellovibrionales bacterium RIFOXYC1_FULL_54_43]|nr:MAG: hypothetical protein A2428_13165 [Bdellovibrionales bacterium RIFOXYC1_FULL_54_43]